MDPEALSKQIAEIKSLSQFIELAGLLRQWDPEELFRVLFAIASDCTAYPYPVYEVATDLLIFLEPRCPVTCREAIVQLGQGHFEASLKRLPFYLISQFGQPQVFKEAEALQAETGASERVRKTAMFVKYWAQCPASYLIDFPLHKLEISNTTPNLPAPKTLNTARLLLRKPSHNDALLVFAAYGQDPEVTRYLRWQPHKSLLDVQIALERFLAGWNSGDEYTWLLFSQTDSELVGAITARQKVHSVELGYVLARKYWNRGFMTEAVRAVADWAFTQPSVFRIWAACDVENAASARVLEKAGFEREGILKSWEVHPNVSPMPRDCCSYARIRNA